MSEEKIRKEQKDYLQSLVCQRLTDDPANEDVIKKFCNNTNPRLPNDLRAGWNVDKRDEVAFYLVKDRENEPLLFFSLKCGVLYTPMFLQKVQEEYHRAKALYNAVVKGKGPKWAVEEIESQKVDGKLPMLARARIYRHFQQMEEEMKGLNREMEEEDNVKITRAKKTYSGVELVHFCNHEPAKEKWVRAGMGNQSMGRTLFWYFIVPKIQEIRRLVGCEYIYLFAADSSEVRSLIDYYESLDFERRIDVGTAKPSYDFGCAFMCQKLTSLKNKRADFFNTYNREKEPPAGE